MNGPRSSTARTGFSCKTSRRGEERLFSVVVLSFFFAALGSAVGAPGVDAGGSFGAAVSVGVGLADASGAGVLRRGGARSWPKIRGETTEKQIAATVKIRVLFIKSAVG